MECIRWNDNQSYPIAINQNIIISEFRQSLRLLVYEYLEFAQQILIIFDNDEQINSTIKIQTYPAKSKLIQVKRLIHYKL